MPRLKAAFALFHASCSRRSPFQRVNVRRAARHSRRRVANWSFCQHIEPLACLRFRRGIEQSQATTTFCLAERTVFSNDPAGSTQPSSSMSRVVSRWTLSLSLQSRLAFQEGHLPSLTLPLSTAWRPCSRLNSMHWWSLKVVSARTDQNSSRKSLTPKSGLQIRMPALLDAS